MLIQVNPHKIVLIKTNDVNSGEYNVNECTFEFSQEFDNLTCIAVFSLCDGTTRNITILNNRCIIPTEVLQQTGQVKIGVYGYSVQDDELVLRYSPTPQIFVVTEGSYKEGTEPVAPTPTDWEILVQQVSDNSRDIADIQEDIGDINTDIGNINNAINDLDDKKANINDLSAVAFSGSYNDLINKPNLSVYATKTDLSDEATLRENADVALQEQIDAISVSSDVVDVVGTYQELLDYDTQHLKDNDIVKVLDDSTHNNALSYYRWDKEPQTWSYIGSEGPFYTKAETQELLNAKEDKITTTNKLDADLVDDSNSTNKFVTQADINNWNNKEDKSNKVTEINSSSTDTEYPSAKCVYDSQTAQDTEIDTLKMIYNILPTDTDTGETISIDNTGEMPIKNIQLGGNTSQVVIPEEQGTSVSNTSIYVSDVNTDKENTIEISGNTYQETTTGKNLYSGGDQTFEGYKSYYIEPISAGSYYISGFVQSTDTDYALNLILFYNDNTVIASKNINRTIGQKTAFNETFTISDTCNKISFYSSNNAANSKGDTATFSDVMISTSGGDYEPYTNGASPNPSYPQNIEVVTGTQNITIANGDNTQSTTYPVNLGNIELCKIDTYQDRIYKQNDKWYLEKNIEKITFNGSETDWNYYTSANKPVFYLGVTTNFNYLQQENLVCYSNYYQGKGQVNSFNDVYDLGNNVIAFRTVYKRLVIRNDNITSVSDFQTWLSTHNTTVYYVLATPTTTEITDTTLVSQLNALNNSTLYATTNINTTTSNLLPYIDLHYNFVTPSPSPSRPSVVNVVKGNNTITISNSDNTESQSYSINLGDMELCKIGTYQDYIYESNGNWYKHSEVGKKIFTGATSEGWWYQNNEFRINTPNAKSGIACISNYFRNDYQGDNYINVYLNDYIAIGYSALNNDVNAFKTWLSNNNTNAYYPLATPTNTQITDTTLITQLDNLQKAISYDSQTNISQTNEDKPFIITAEMFLSLKNVLN